MTSDTTVNISSIEENDIHRARIVDGNLVPDEYFCSICQYILWKPRPRSSCQHVFCQKCIRTWSKNVNSENKCLFRCQSFEDRPCPPDLQSLLSHLNIHCRNAKFGCSKIISYDRLEHHENVECQYLTKQCLECEQFILLSKYVEHQQIKGLCIPCPIKCTICQLFIQETLFRQHFHQCCREKKNQLIQREFPDRNIETRENNQPVSVNHEITFFQRINNTIKLFEQQKQMSRLPTSLKGIDAVQRAQQQNRGHLYYLLIMFKFILLNWSKIPFFIFNMVFGGFLVIFILIFGRYFIFCHWVYTHIYRGPAYLILFNLISFYVPLIIFQSFSDLTIIFFFGLLTFLWGCLSRIPLEILEMNVLFNKPIVCIFLCCLSLLITKIILLLIRSSYWLMPTYISLTLLTFIHFYVAFHIYRIYANALATTNQLIMPV